MDLIMPEVTFNPTFNCILNCRLCGAFTPYMNSNERIVPLEETLKSIDSYFKIVPHVRMVTICGGEPLLFPQLAEVIYHLKKYAAQIDKMRIVTSGTVIPSQQVLDAMRELGEQFYVMQDNYGPTISKRGKELDDILTENRIPYTVRNYTAEDSYCNGWVDVVGDFTEKKHTKAEAERLYAACGAAKCYTVIGGRMWHCTVNFLLLDHR